MWPYSFSLRNIGRVWLLCEQKSFATTAFGTTQQTLKSNIKASTAAIKELRYRTGAPISTVKKALEEQNGDIDASIDHLRKLGASMLAKKAHRDTTQGLVSIAFSADKRKAAIVEMNSETDFVARTPQFKKLIQSMANSALSTDLSISQSVTSLQHQDLLTGENKDLLSDAISVLGENIVLRRASIIQVPEHSGCLHSYIHGIADDNSGKIGVLVALKGSNTEDIGKRLAMHIAAAAPKYLTSDRVPPAHVEKEHSILIEAAKAEQKPGSKAKSPKIFEHIADGRLKKWFSEVALLQQEMLVEDQTYGGKPRSVFASMRAASEDGAITEFLRFSVNETSDSV